ncbi:hypothetical protein CQA53_12015, partial [Helicobacter didelphidarum]
MSPIDSNTKLNITGHSLGGCLAQLFTLSFARYDKGERGIINEVYTYNAPGARDLSIDDCGVIDIDLSHLSNYDRETREELLKEYIHSLDLENITNRLINKPQLLGRRATYNDWLYKIREYLKRFLAFQHKKE